LTLGSGRPTMSTPRSDAKCADAGVAAGRLARASPDKHEGVAMPKTTTLDAQEYDEKAEVPFLARWETWESAPVDSKKIGADDTKSWRKDTQDRDT